MQTTDFRTVFEPFPKVAQKFKGAFPCDLIPTNLLPLECFIFNLDSSKEKGSHWLACICISPEMFEIFDSLGGGVQKLSSLLNIPAEKITCNTESFQLPFTNSCGLFATYFIVHRLMNLDLSLHDLLTEIFDSNKDYNEVLVADFFKHLC